MTDKKPMWKRHNGACNQRIFNDPIDWEGHLRNCPYDIRQKLNNLLKSLEKLNLEERLDLLEQADPAADAFAVEDGDSDEGYDEDDLIDDERDEETQNLTTVDYFTRPTA